MTHLPDLRCAHALLDAGHAWAALAILAISTEPGARFAAAAIQRRQEPTAMAHIAETMAKEAQKGVASGLEGAQGSPGAENAPKAAQGAPKRAQACGL